mmetsp:Transcript_19101/g.44506  ORF Transcript_19101/g.44506 Transcript_19101/m.44506 type:complete len:222 (+) Transcript_19101:238-903(+)
MTIVELGVLGHESKDREDLIALKLRILPECGGVGDGGAVVLLGGRARAVDKGHGGGRSRVEVIEPQGALDAKGGKVGTADSLGKVAVDGGGHRLVDIRDSVVVDGNGVEGNAVGKHWAGLVRLGELDEGVKNLFLGRAEVNEGADLGWVLDVLLDVAHEHVAAALDDSQADDVLGRADMLAKVLRGVAASLADEFIHNLLADGALAGLNGLRGKHENGCNK